MGNTEDGKPLTPVETLQEIAYQYGVDELAAHVLDDPRFGEWSGCGNPKRHHYGAGGLAQHTLEVTQLCLSAADYCHVDSTLPGDVNPQWLILACIFHDYGKIWDYARADDGSFSKAEHARKIHHITRSSLEWSKAFHSPSTTPTGKRLVRSMSLHDEVLHAILAHHGRPEWHSPVTPVTRMAWLLHLNDGISARMYDANSYDYDLK